MVSPTFHKVRLTCFDIRKRCPPEMTGSFFHVAGYQRTAFHRL